MSNKSRWNRPRGGIADSHGRGRARPSHRRKVLLALAVLCVLLAGGAFFVLRGSGREGGTETGDSSRPPLRTGKATHPMDNKTVPRKSATAKTAKEIAAEFNDQVRSFVKAKTNNIVWIVPPTDPDDPDNALRTRVSQELGSLLSIEPGEAMPPFPYSFLLEDDMRKAAASGEEVGEIDNGNKTFLEGLKKFRIVAKEGDDERRLNHKAALLAAQDELLRGMDEGLSVNDSIRAAYEFRKHAYELRSEAIKTMTEFIEAGEDVEETISVLKQMNAKFAEEGIKAILPEEIGIEEEAESEEPQAEKQQPEEEEKRQ